MTETSYQTGGALVVGAGLAGLFTALKLAPLPALVLSPQPLGQGASSAWAQGGVAAALAAGDSAAAHAADTVAAGAGTVDAGVAAAVAAEAAARIMDLVALGTPFDRDAGGALVQSREAAHSAARVVRVRGDTAGRAIMEALIAAVRATPSIRVLEGVAAESLLLEAGRVAGVRARAGGLRFALRAPAVVLATGGIGGLYAVTSNPAGVAGQGLGMAARAGAVIRDPEFVQFHPTGLAVDARPVPLASEALRGEGAWLIDETGARVMAGIPGGELAPRDVVARALHRHIAAGHRVFLDTRAAIGAAIDRQFPTIAASCRAAGIDPVAEPIPVQPIQHYHMGGVATDAEGQTSLDRLWAVGEVACTGLHGANRLASNSLLEALVFGARAAAAIRRAVPEAAGPGDAISLPAGAAPGPGDPWPEALRLAMTAEVGLERDGPGLTRALAEIARHEAASAEPGLRNMTAAATLVAAAALRRRESRGGHARRDHPEPSPAQERPTLLTLAEAEAVRRDAAQDRAA
ncbi:L-aspartate oxidase [Paralimibaculum aggregatum]|uniref:L-aspartate oxidase n=1 Tax=Paralimibaculum aggregatum TaxID=3036245 RepID=A0ABQ6LQ82_9RHOB|nr:L-aspartate oxidase [Limibaculum sp. NKW23]GMG84680.1 L-aspartate oxidase [Limibaculum sp. NKW23]